MKRYTPASFYALALWAVFQMTCISVSAQWVLAPTITRAVCEEQGGGGGSVTVDVSGMPGPYTYSWSSGGTGNEEKNLSGGTVTVDVRNAFGKDTSASFYVPQDSCNPGAALVFTPNGDGIHDVWNIGNSSLYPNMLVLVYNRWGQLVYQNKGRYEPWDGKSLLGLPVDDATYYYIIYKDAGNRGRGYSQGSVTIMR